MAENELKQVAIRLVEQPPLYSKESIKTTDDAVRFMREYLKDMDRELFCIINLNTRLMPINLNVVSMGTPNETVVEMRELFKSAILSNATGIMAFHNHPSGDVTPSQQDLSVTKRIVATAALMNIPLLDHIIIGAGDDDEYYSMREHGVIEDILQNIISMDDAIKETGINTKAVRDAKEMVSDTKEEYEIKEQNKKYDPHAKTKEFRENVANAFIEGLEQNGLAWKKGWKNIGGLAMNAKTNKPYNGINQFYLQLISVMKGYTDPRWMTFKQIRNTKGLHLQQGSKGVQIEYWFPYDKAEKKSISHEERERLIREEDRDPNDFILVPKYFYVFNGSCIDGLPELKNEKLNDIRPSEVIDVISKGMNVPILNHNGDRAFYTPELDSVHLPQPGQFLSDEEYNSTALHELAHATGHPSRLNRDQKGFFGSEDYAREELVAEITSAFMMCNIGVNADSYDLDNHKAYVNSWIDVIKKSPDELMKAIKDANKAADYMEGFIKEAEKEKVVTAEKQPEEKERVLHTFKDVDIVSSLGAIMKENTAFYQSDFEIDKKIFKDAMMSDNPEDKHFLWLSKPCGTHLYRERDVFLQGTSENNGWTFYGEYTNDSIIAYAVELTGKDEDGTLRGNLYELDYQKHYKEVQKEAMPTEHIKITYENGERIVSEDEFRSAFNNSEYGSAISCESFPKDERAFKQLLNREQSIWKPKKEGNLEEHIADLHERRIEREAQRIVDEFKNLYKPNNKMKDGYTVDIDPYFRELASNNDDIEKMVSMLPYENVSLTEHYSCGECLGISIDQSEDRTKGIRKIGSKMKSFAKEKVTEIKQPDLEFEL